LEKQIAQKPQVLAKIFSITRTVHRRTTTMTARRDVRGNPLSGADDAAAAAYAEGLLRLNLFVGDPVASAEEAIAAAPAFVMGHVLRAWLFLLSTEAPAGVAARGSWEAARDLPMTTQEAGHVAAVGHLLEGRWHRAAGGDSGTQ
jgi:hypothetical protein